MEEKHSARFNDTAPAESLRLRRVVHVVGPEDLPEVSVAGLRPTIYGKRMIKLKRWCKVYYITMQGCNRNTHYCVFDDLTFGYYVSIDTKSHIIFHYISPYGQIIHQF